MNQRDSAGKAITRFAGAVLLCALLLVGGCSRTTHAATAVTSAQPGSAPATARVASPAVPSTTVTTVDKALYHDSSLTVTLTTVAVNRDHQVTAHLSYRNVGSAALTLSCSGVASPAIDTLTSADGTLIRASHSYCSDHAAATIDLPPGGTLISYAVFEGVQASSGPFTLTWQENEGLSGSVSGITLS